MNWANEPWTQEMFYTRWGLQGQGERGGWVAHYLELVHLILSCLRLWVGHQQLTICRDIKYIWRQVKQRFLHIFGLVSLTKYKSAWSLERSIIKLNQLRNVTLGWLFVVIYSLSERERSFLLASFYSVKVHFMYKACLQRHFMLWMTMEKGGFCCLTKARMATWTLV